MYSRWLAKSPILTKSLTSGVLTFGGDVVCQVGFPTEKESKYDIARTARFSFLGTLTLIFPPSLQATSVSLRRTLTHIVHSVFLVWSLQVWPSVAPLFTTGMDGWRPSGLVRPLPPQ